MLLCIFHCDWKQDRSQESQKGREGLLSQGIACLETFKKQHSLCFNDENFAKFEWTDDAATFGIFELVLALSCLWETASAIDGCNSKIGRFKHCWSFDSWLTWSKNCWSRQRYLCHEFCYHRDQRLGWWMLQVVRVLCSSSNRYQSNNKTIEDWWSINQSINGLCSLQLWNISILRIRLYKYSTTGFFYDLFTPAAAPILNIKLNNEPLKNTTWYHTFEHQTH